MKYYWTGKETVPVDVASDAGEHTPYSHVV